MIVIIQIIAISMMIQKIINAIKKARTRKKIIKNFPTIT